MSKYTITLLRHGESIGNAQGFHQGQADFPLNGTGRAQAQALANRWKKEGVSFDCIITSPLKRALETAQIIAEATQSPLETNPIWMERNAGLYSGLKPDDAARRYPQPDFIHPYQAFGLTGESQWELYLRAGAAIQDLINHSPGKYLVVSHGGILNLVLYAILGIIPQANFGGPRFRFANSGFATLTYIPDDHTWRLIGINDTAHLSNGLDTVGMNPDVNGIGAGEEPVLAENDQQEQDDEDREPQTPNLAIRTATAADLDALTNLFVEINEYHRQAVPDLFQTPEDHTILRNYLAGYLNNEEDQIFVAEVDGKVVGYLLALIRMTPDLPFLVQRQFCLIDTVVVHQPYRNQGIGRRLMERAETWAKEKGVKELQLGVHEFNRSAIALYEHMGYSMATHRMRKKIEDPGNPHGA